MPGPRPSPLLPTIAGREDGFRVAAVAPDLISWRRLRAADLVMPTAGVRRTTGLELDIIRHASDFALGLPPDIAFCQVTAARLWSLPLPTRWSPTEPLHVMRQTSSPRIERTGCTSHRGLDRRAVVHQASGLRVVHPVQTWADLATVLALDDLVAVGDTLVKRAGGPTADDLVGVAERRGGRRGSVRLRAAAALVRPGSESPWESKGRVLFHQWDLPEPELNVDIWADDGTWLARPDWVWRHQRVVGEYDGDQHRTDRRVWQYERERRAGLEADGWRYVEMTHLTLTSAPHRDALRRRLIALLVA